MNKKIKYNDVINLEDNLNALELLGEVEYLRERINKAIDYINKYEYSNYMPGPYEDDKYIMREEKEGQDLLNILKGEDK